jgi:hypothetical protein
MSIRRAATTLASLLLAASVCAGCSGTSPVGTPPSSTVVPPGWKTYTYGNARISVPSNWVVVTDYTCPDTVAPGVLYLGPSRNPGEVCPFTPSIDTVTVTPLPAGTPDQPQCPIQMNGLRVYLGPCSSSNPIAVVFYNIPSLGIRAEGMGTNSQNVTGSGTGTVVGQVLHTLRPR